MKKNKIFFIVAVISFFASACVYDFVAPEAAPSLPDGGGNGEETVSFVADVVPIFADKCTACHKVGGSKPNPDLTADKAYTTLATTKYINLETPEESRIYKYISPSTSTHSQRKYTASEAQIILTWIQEGAKNN